MAILEAHAYWCQDQYIRRHSNLTLNDLVINNDTKEVRYFRYIASLLYNGFMPRYLYNAVLWFNEEPKKKFERLVNGGYVMRPLL